MSSEKRIIITHCVDPHNFYFKYVDECLNNEYSKFDYMLQCYGNDLYGRQSSTHTPDKNELIIFFDIISNKWLRGRVVYVNDHEITLWCFDNGILRKTEMQFIQPLNDDLKKEFNLVHLGGVSVLPAETTLNYETLNVKMRVTHSWDKEMNNNFKAIIDSAKRINFVEEMGLENHKFGTLSTETWRGKVVVVNEILLQMNKVIACGGSAGMTTYIVEKRMREEFHQSLEKVTSLSKSINSRRTSIASGKCEIDMIINPFKSETVSDVSDHADWMYPKRASKSCYKAEIEVLENLVKSNKSSGVSRKADAVELFLEPVQPEETSSKCGKSKVDSFKPNKHCGATAKSVEKQHDKGAVKSIGTSRTSDKSKKETEENPFKTKRPTGASSTSSGIELLLEPVKPNEASSTSNKTEMKIEENSIEPNRTSGASSKSGGTEPDLGFVKHNGTAGTSDVLKPETGGNVFKAGKMSDTSISSIKVHKYLDTSTESELEMDENPFKPKKPSGASGKCDGKESHWKPVKLEVTTSKFNKSKDELEENHFEPKRTCDALGKSSGTELDFGSAKPKETESTIDKFKMEENPFQPKKASGATGKCDGKEFHREPVKPELPATKSKDEVEESLFKPKRSSSASEKSGGAGPDVASIKHNVAAGTSNLSKPEIVENSVKPSRMYDALITSDVLKKYFEFLEPAKSEEITHSSNKSELAMDGNPFKPKKTSGFSRKSDGVDLQLEPAKPKTATSTSDKSNIELEYNPFKQKKTPSASGKSGGTEPDFRSVKPQGTAVTSVKSEKKIEENLFKPEKATSASSISDGVELHLESVKPERTTSKSDRSNMNSFNPKKPSSESNISDGMESDSRPVKPMRTSGRTLDKSEMKTNDDSFVSHASGRSDGSELRKSVTPKEAVSAALLSEADILPKAKRLHASERIDQSSIQNGFDSIESIDITGLCSEQQDTDLPSLDGSLDTPDTVSMAVSTIHAFMSAPQARRNMEKAKSLRIDYECHLKTLKCGNDGGTLRQPHQSSIDWINQQRSLVADDSESCNSSIIHLMDD